MKPKKHKWEICVASSNPYESTYLRFEAVSVISVRQKGEDAFIVDGLTIHCDYYGIIEIKKNGKLMSIQGKDKICLRK